MELPRLRLDQYQIAIHPAKVKVLTMGRRWGKTVLGGALVGLALQQHGRAAWIAPTFKNTRPMWRWLLASTAEDVRHRRIAVHKSDRTLETRHGGYLGLYSGENIDSIRGESFNLVVLDEAARLSEDAWTDAIMPTLADYDGDAVLISTPKGKNWFYNEWMRGQGDDPELMSWTAPTCANPIPSIQRAFAKVRSRVTEQTFQQEWLAQFVEEGTVFRRIREAATAIEAQPDPGHQYIFGVDWARTNDWTVVSVIDATTKRMVFMDRFNQIDYRIQVSRLKALAERYKPDAIVAESNSMGGPLVETLQWEDLPVQPFVTTNATKAAIIDGLALAFERGELAILNDATLIAELRAYESERLPSGLIRYSAPEGLHDDCVMSLALAWYGCSTTGPLIW